MYQFLFPLLFSGMLTSGNTGATESCDLQQVYATVFTIEKEMAEDQTVLRKRTVTTDSSHCLHGLIANNPAYLDYLLHNFTEVNDAALLAREDSTLQEAFIQALQNDSLFNEEMEKFAGRLIDPMGFQPDTVTIHEMLDVAVKFFALTGVSEEGFYQGKICAGNSGIETTSRERNPQLEAFCYAAVQRNQDDGHFNLYGEFAKAISELYTLNLGVDRQENLLRAQGAVYLMMRNNQQLKDMLISEYICKEQVLPFVLVLEEEM